MSFSYTYLTRRQFLMNYRDSIGVANICSFFGSKFLTYNSRKSDNEFTMVRVYTDDETDVNYRDVNNKADNAVKREKIVKFAKQILKLVPSVNVSFNSRHITISMGRATLFSEYFCGHLS